MNFSINFLYLNHFLFQSSFLNINNNKINKNYIILNSNFQNFFSNFLINKNLINNIKLFRNNFENFLNIPLIFNKLLIISTMLELNQTGNVYLNNLLFKNCLTNDKSGAIYIFSSNLNFYAKNCAFLKCYTSTEISSSGALLILYVNSSITFNLCFEKCSTNNKTASFHFQTFFSGLYFTEFNYSVEFNCGDYIQKARHSSFIGGNTYLKYFNNNNTHNIATVYSGGIGFQKSSLIFSKFNQISNNSGVVFFSIHSFETNLEIEYFNFINNLNQLGWINYIGSASILLKISKCFFNNNFNNNLFYIYTSSIGNIIFDNCIFEKIISNNFISYCQIKTNCIYNSSLNNKISLIIINSNNCWNYFTKIFPKKIFQIIFLLQFINY